jgi:hypothetical protein
LYDDGELVFRVELAGIGQVTGVKRHLDILDVVDILLCILDKLFDIDLLRRDDATDFIGKAFPARVLVAYDTFDEIGKG